MDRSSTVRFAHAARHLGAAARAAGLTVPAFRSPPRRPGAPRTIRRLPGGPVVAVVLRDRVFAEVVADMVEGIVIANRLQDPAAAPGPGWRNGRRRRLKPAGPNWDVEVRLLFRAHTHAPGRLISNRPGPRTR